MIDWRDIKLTALDIWKFELTKLLKSGFSIYYIHLYFNKYKCAMDLEL